MFKKFAVAAATLSPLAAFAEVPAEVTTALTDGKADALAVAGLALVIVIGVAVFKYMKRGV